MSTVITNAYRIKANNFSTIISIINDMVEELEIKKEAVILKRFGVKYINLLDDLIIEFYTSNKEFNPKNHIFNSGLGYSFEEKDYNYILNDFSKSKGITMVPFLKEVFNVKHTKVSTSWSRDPDFDFNCTIKVSTIHNSKYSYFLFNYEQGNYDSVIERYKKRGLEEYNFWNNTDRPENITKKEWEQRKTTWDNLFEHGRFVKYDLLTYFDKPFGSNLEDNIKYIIENIPSMEARLHRISKRILIQQKFDMLLGSKSKSIEGISCYHSAVDYFVSLNESEKIFKLNTISELIKEHVIKIDESNFLQFEIRDNYFDNIKKINIPILVD